MRIRDVVLVASLVPIASAAHGFQATTPLALQRATGHYEGTATSGPGREAVSADLRVVGGTLVGTLSTGDGPIAVTGGTLAGDVRAGRG